MAKPAALAQFKTVYGITMVFDPGKISMLDINVPPPNMPGLPPHPAPATATEVYGLDSGVLWVPEDPATLLTQFGVADKFLTLTYTTGYKVYLRATSIAWLSPDTNPVNPDPKGKCLIFAAGKLFSVLEDFTTVKKQYDDLRQKASAD